MVEPHGSISRIITANFWVTEILGLLPYLIPGTAKTTRSHDFCVPSKASDQAGHLRSLVRVLGQKNICVFQVSRPYLGICLGPKHFIVDCEQKIVKYAEK